MTIPTTPSVKEMKVSRIRFIFEQLTTAKPFGIIAWLLFIPGMYFISLHTETLLKPYLKHT